MATIFFGVNGEGLGHASRTLATVDRLPEHECHLFTYGKAYHFLGDLGYAPLHRIDGLMFAFAGGRVSYLRTGLAAARFCMAGLRRNLRAIDGLADRYRPQVYVSDFEPSVPRAGHRRRPAGAERGQPAPAGLRRHRPPAPAPAVLRAGVRGGGRGDGSAAFAHGRVHLPLRPDPPPPRSGDAHQRASPRTGARHHSHQRRVRAGVPAAERERAGAVRRRRPPAGRPVGRRAVCGVRGPADSPTRRRLEGHPAVEFRPLGPNFTGVVAGADCVVSTGGSQLLTEARHFRKPLLVVPEPGQYEQWINAHYAVSLRMGEMCPAERLTGGLLRRFLRTRDGYRQQPVMEDGAATVAGLIRRYTGAHSETAAPELSR